MRHLGEKFCRLELQVLVGATSRVAPVDLQQLRIPSSWPDTIQKTLQFRV